MIIKKNSQKYREVVKPKMVQKSVVEEPVVEESFSPEITYPQTSEEVEEDNDDDFQAQPQENLPKEPEIDLFDIENIDFEQRQERRRGSRRRGYRRIDDRNLVSRAQEEAEAIYAADDIVKLFLQESNKYECYSTNWGASKGLDKFKDICIVLNKTTLKAYRTGNLGTISPSTLRKLYVACTRAKGNIYFVPHTFIDKYKKQSS